jgi:hypothetical protein
VLDDEIWSLVSADLAHVVSGIEAGWFPATPLKPQYRPWVDCGFCEPDSLGTAERWHEWEHKRSDPRLAAWFAGDDESPDGVGAGDGGVA